MTPEFWGAAQKSPRSAAPAMLQVGERQQWRLKIWVQTVLYSKCDYKRQWNFSGDGSAAHTDYKD